MNRGTVLVVDEGPSVYTTIETVLSEGCFLYRAATAEEALQRCAEHRPTLIVLDLSTPGLDGLALLDEVGVSPGARHTIIVLADQNTEHLFEACYRMGVTAFLRKPYSLYALKGLVKQALSERAYHLALKHDADRLENLVQRRTAQLSEHVQTLERTQEALGNAMGNLVTVQVAPGMFWLQIPEADLYILCGCPGEAVKHLMHQGLIRKVVKDGVACETGPNVILLSEVLVQNGGFANLAEFPVLQMLYRQGMILPDHPNNTGVKPMLIGAAAQVQAQLAYIHRGNYGLVSKEELLACGVDEEMAEYMMRVKLKFAFGAVHPPSQLLDTLEIDHRPSEIRHGVTVARTGFNRYRFAFRGRTTEIDLTLPPNTLYSLPYVLGNHRFRRQYFAVLHRGDGDGWDPSRPSMGSVLMFQGRIYLLDAGPGVFYSMMALGIDISEVDGVFHTHGHDDHFAGLPALIHAGHRLKYFATPPVRAAVAKKFTALMSMEEEKFGQFFDICDLTLDTWNNCGGLEVLPLYSPHPIETNIFLFRALDGDGYKSFGYWADLSSYRVLDGMVGDGPGDLPAAFIDTIKKNYKRPANLKKLDIGGGLIHGVAEDFRDDASGRLILSHTNRALTTEEMEIGSETAFGALDVLIPGAQDYLYQRTFYYLYHFFKGVDPGQIHMLLNTPIINYNAGTILHRRGERLDHLDMIVAGTAAYLDSQAGVRNHLSFGSLIGASLFFGKQEALVGSYRACSHCSVIRFSAPMFRAFLENNNIFNSMVLILDKVTFLNRSALFGEQTSFSVLGKLAHAMVQVTVSAQQEVPFSDEPTVWLVKTGEVSFFSPSGVLLERLSAGRFFGEHTHFSRSSEVPWTFRADQEVELYALRGVALLEMPIVHWKMLEEHEKRKQRLLACHRGR